MNVIDLLKRHEGFRSHVYHCTANKRTIGYGYNIDANPLGLRAYELERFKSKGISEKTAENLLIDQVRNLKRALDQAIPWWSTINQARRDVLIDMAYNLGLNGLLAFKKTLARIAAHDYTQASYEMLCSNWAKQVKGRAEELSEIMRTGHYN